MTGAWEASSVTHSPTPCRPASCKIPTSVPQGLGIAAVIGGILVLLAPFIGGALGGAKGAKTGQNRTVAEGGRNHAGP